MVSLPIIEIKEESPRNKTFFFEWKSKIDPGEFFMLWMPGVDEVPMSVSYFKDNIVGFKVTDIGECTHAMHQLKVGDIMGLRGPLGNKFRLEGKKIGIVGGGIGMAPLVYWAEHIGGSCDLTVFGGYRSKDEVLYRNRFGELSCNYLIATDDGSEGHKGFVTELFEKSLTENKFDIVYTCGPEIMMKKVFDLCEQAGIECQASTERYMKCGIGICDVCSIDGYLCCKDGPIFGSEKLRNMSEFNTYHRNKAGVKVPISEEVK